MYITINMNNNRIYNKLEINPRKISINKYKIFMNKTRLSYV